MTPRVSIVIPVYNEGEEIIPVVSRITELVEMTNEVLIVHDTPDDTTVPVIATLAEKLPSVRGILNTYGRGPANAIKFGIDSATAPVVVVTMADGCDDPSQIDTLARRGPFALLVCQGGHA